MIRPIGKWLVAEGVVIAAIYHDRREIVLVQEKWREELSRLFPGYKVR